ncbi:mannose-binding lectin superfamily protein [Striga asiatica]|uniref:Mannose-binding lectin superfamily protein n=1 Tax=Striga asiatica TaxID=4170 RepID=A0A5A7P4K4_STRAF|nr:mannose-binding lectin superfamily protein [Striga asiatica]
MIALGPWGGPDGRPWSFRTRGGDGISSITIHIFQTIRSISFTDSSGAISGTFGGVNHTGPGQQTLTVNINWPSEYLKYISIGISEFQGKKVIRYISFGTNMTTHGPFGWWETHPITIPIGDNIVVGFHGRSDGQLLDALGVFVRPVHPERIIRLGPWPGFVNQQLYQQPFDFKVATCIKEITVQTQNTRLIALAFRDANGRHGSTSGVNGYLGSITFITNLTRYGPFGETLGDDDLFDIPINGATVNGFHGTAGENGVGQIGLHAKEASPWGGSGGNSWTYKAANGGGINQVLMNVGRNIRSIAFRDNTGIVSHPFGAGQEFDAIEEAQLCPFPRSYNDKYYADVLASGEFTKLDFLVSAWIFVVVMRPLAFGYMDKVMFTCVLSGIDV